MSLGFIRDYSEGLLTMPHADDCSDDGTCGGSQAACCTQELFTHNQVQLGCDTSRDFEWYDLYFRFTSDS